MLKGKTAAEAKEMSSEELAAPLGSLPPVKIHCAQLVEGALRSALSAETPVAAAPPSGPTLLAEMAAPTNDSSSKVKIVFHQK
jgi:hypothetical protein